MAETRTIRTVKQPYKTNDGTILYMGTLTVVEVDANGKYVPNSAVVSLRLYDTTSSILGTDFKTVAIRNAGEPWRLTQDGNGNYVAGLDLQRTLADRNSIMNKNLNNHVSNALQAPLQGVPAGQVNTNTQSSANAAAGLPPTTGSARPDPGGTQNGPNPDATRIDLDVLNLQIDTENPNPTFEDLVYPTGIRNNGQDFIKFTVIKYIPRKLNVISTGFGILGNRPDASNQNLGQGQEIQVKGSIILPIQPSISDSNSVDWNGTRLDPLGMTLAGTSLNLASRDMTQQDLNALFTSAGQTLSNENVQKAFRLYLAQKAAGVEGLLSRVAGAVVNPNLELLFQGPTLRPFNFTFRLSPRDNDEAIKVRKIIRVFKQYSAAGTTSGGLFLTTPNVFDIQYVAKRGEGEDHHKSLNRIKTCALKSVSVDYTPDGSYMTFNDEARTMTSYSLSLQFQELEPVTTKDYNMDPDHIGY